MDALRKKFKPEFINRIDVISIFQPLTSEDLSKIATIMISNINKRLQKQGTELKITASALKFIVTKGANFEYGARPLKRFIQTEVEDTIAEKILTGVLDKNGTIVIDSNGAELVFYNEK